MGKDNDQIPLHKCLHQPAIGLLQVNYDHPMSIMVCKRLLRVFLQNYRQFLMPTRVWNLSCGAWA